MVVPSRMLEAKIEAPPMVEVSGDRKTVSIDVRAEITNVSDSDYVVHAPGAEHQHFWHVLDENNREIARGGAIGAQAADSRQFLGKTIAAGLSAHDSHRLVLPTQRLKDGKTYTLRSEIFGQIAQTEFVVVRPERAAKKAAGKKKAVKKAIKKKIARKKAARRAKGK